MRQKRIDKTQKRRVRDLKNNEDGKLDVDLDVGGEMHSSAFMVPVPIYYPVGYMDYAGVCTAVSSTRDSEVAL